MTDRGQFVLVTAVVVAVGLVAMGVVVGHLAYGGTPVYAAGPVADTQTAVHEAVERTSHTVAPRPTTGAVVDAWTTVFDEYVETIERQTAAVVTVRRNQTAAAEHAKSTASVTATDGVLVERRGDVAVVVGVVVDIEVTTRTVHGETTDRIPAGPRIEPVD